MPWYGVLILEIRRTGCDTNKTESTSNSALSTASRVLSFEPPSELTMTDFRSGKYFAKPALTARTT
jgi:hypothetical protein